MVSAVLRHFTAHSYGFGVSAKNPFRPHTSARVLSVDSDAARGEHTEREREREPNFGFPLLPDDISTWHLDSVRFGISEVGQERYHARQVRILQYVRS